MLKRLIFVLLFPIVYIIQWFYMLFAILIISTVGTVVFIIKGIDSWDKFTWNILDSSLTIINKYIDIMEKWCS